MGSGGPWNFRGFRPETRDTAREAVRPSDVSVGDWLNSVIRPADEDDEEPPRSAQFDRPPKHRRPDARHDERERDRAREAQRRRRGLSEDEPVRRAGAPYRSEPPRDRDDRQRRDSAREHELEQEAAYEAKRAWRVAEAARAREEVRETERLREQARREAERERGEADKAERAREQARREAERKRDEAREAERACEEARREVERARDEAREARRVREDEARRQAERALDIAYADDAREAARPAERSEALRNREDLSELHGRLDQISSQLERLAQTDIAQRRLASRQRLSPAPPSEAVAERAAALTGAPQAPPRASTQRSPADPPAATERAPAAADRAPAGDADASIERAVAEITARQRVLAGEAPVQSTLRAPPPSAPPLASTVPAAPPESRPARAENLRPEIATASFATGPAPAENPRPEALQQQSPPHEPAPAPTVDLSGLERQLRQITSQIEALRPASGLEKAIEGLRADLSEIGRSITEALPRRAVESLEIEIKALAQRIDHSRECGLDTTALAGLERGLADVREALRGLTTAESLVGFDEAVRALTGKVDAIAAKDDPAALQQLETAIGGLRGVVAHVASNDALTKVAEDVRALSAKVDGLANSAASGRAVSALESRIDTLANALSASTGADQAVSALGSRIDTLASAVNASTEAGHAVPQQLEKLLAGLIEKLEWVQLTHTDHAALAHLEDRIAMLVRRFDASDAHLVHLEAVGRGLADLLVHIEQLRSTNGKAIGPAEAGAPAAVGAIERDVAEVKQTERRTRESLEAVQETVEHVVDRLAMIESGIRVDTAGAAPTAPSPAKPQQPAVAPPVFAPAAATPPAAAAGPSPIAGETAYARPALPQPTAARQPIDPNLPPNHPLEPGSAGRSRQLSAADRIAASEAAIGTKPPVIPDPGGKPDFIAAARRAAQAAAATALERSPGAKAGTAAEPLPKTLTQRLRKLIVPIAVVLIVIGGFRVVSRLFEGHDAPAVPEMQGEKTAAPATAPPEASVSKAPMPEGGAGPAANVEAPPPRGPGLGSAPESNPAGQSLNGDVGTGSAADEAAPASKPERRGAAASPPADVTGSLPRSSPSHSGASAAALPGVLDEKLPATIGAPALRAAALSGDPAAAYEVAMRFAEGRGVAQNNEEAAHWLDRAAKLGLAPAQFRLGSLYEKGIGVKKNLATARDFYRAAADKGHAKAMHNLAVLYAEGVDGAADYRTAAQWFRKAADHGITDSQYNLGILYARGIGVEQNFAESYKWFVLAADRGDKDAAKKRDEVTAHLDQQSLAAARLAAQNWTAEPQPAEATELKAWDPPASATPAPKPKPRSAGAKQPPPAAVKVD
jgi:localization factor PodJL